MFSNIAPNYDRTNSVLSLGVHHLWRRAAVRMTGARRGSSALDCATGTGDLALALKRVVGLEGLVVGTDFNAAMLSHAPGKGLAKGLDVRWEVADVMNLPYEDATFDVATIAFGIRNVDDPVRALAEMGRVCKPGGRVVVLEFGQPRGILGFAYRTYSRYVIPLIGGLLTGTNTFRAPLRPFHRGKRSLHSCEVPDVSRRWASSPLPAGLPICTGAIACSIAYLYWGDSSVGLR